MPSTVAKHPETIRSMFGSIAPVYDGLNHAFSLNIDKLWRRYAVRQAVRPSDRRILDIACGTGDLTLDLMHAAPRRCEVVGVDFCLPMLRLARRKGRGLPFLQGDGLRLPFADSSFDLVTIAFGLRNMADHKAGLREMCRVLRPGGRVAVLDFTTPPNPAVRAAYLAYFRHILPAVGDAVSGSSAYRYLSRSVLEWPSPRELGRTFRACGFERVRWSELSLGIAVLHIGQKPGGPSA